MLKGFFSVVVELWLRLRVRRGGETLKSSYQNLKELQRPASLVSTKSPKLGVITPVPPYSLSHPSQCKKRTMKLEKSLWQKTKQMFSMIEMAYLLPKGKVKRSHILAMFTDACIQGKLSFCVFIPVKSHQTLRPSPWAVREGGQLGKSDMIEDDQAKKV